MLGTSLQTDPESALSIKSNLPSPVSVTEGLVRWAVITVYGGLTVAVALTGAVTAVYAGILLPTTFATVLLRWLAVVVLVAGAPNLAGRILRRIFAVFSPDPNL